MTIKNFYLSFLIIFFLGLSFSLYANQEDSSQESGDPTSNLEKPLYSPFIERFILDELLKLRTDLGKLRTETLEQITDREIKAVDSAVNYATNTMTYFFYLITGVSSVLVLVGWTSLREIKNKIHNVADQEISKLVSEYEQRLYAIEKQLSQKTKHIKENREEIELTQEVQSLWLRAGQETHPSSKITIYDQILKIKPEHVEAYTYKADAVLELGEPQWALNLCEQALEIDSENIFAYFQLACVHSILGNFEDAMSNLEKVLEATDSYRQDILNDPALENLRESSAFKTFYEENLIKEEGE